MNPNPTGKLRASAVIASVLALSLGCKVEDPELPLTGSSSVGNVGTSVPGAPSSSPPPASGPSTGNGLGAPTIVNPLPGNSLSSSTPTLTVRNVSSSDGTAPTYEFQVALDDGFQTVAASVTGHPQGSGGETSWQVTPPLAQSRYFWRARGVGARGAGPYSPISDFFITSGGAPPPSPAPSPSPSPSPSASEVFDPLTNGHSVGEVHGGQFGASGWQVRNRGDFIRYVVPTIHSGFVEWENVGLRPLNPQRDLYTLFGMWDPSRGPYRENPFRVHVRKLDTQGHNPPYVRLRFISGGDQHDVGYDFMDWNPGRAYQWRVEWGPGGSGNEARVLLDGRVVIRTGYGPAYRPTDHWIEMGVEERAESIIGVYYRNVRIGRR